jgi:hypothetical protein
MGALSALRNLFSTRAPLLAPIDDPFIQIDRPAIVAKLELEKRGAEQGGHDLPAPDTQTFDQVEAEIVSEIAEQYARAQIDGANQVRVYDNRLAELGLLAELSSIRSHARQAVGDYVAEVANSRNHLATSRDAIAESYEELRAFKKEHRLTRPAHAAAPGLVTWSAIFGAWFVEAGANTFLLRLNDDLGFIGGAAAASIIAALNVGLATAVGRYILPWTSARGPAQRVAGYGLTVLWFGTMLLWNLLAAHFRDAKALGMPRPDNEALGLLVSQPFQLDSIYSWGLLIAGCVCAVAAALVAFRMDDPYPGYGAISRRHAERCADYAAEVDQATDELREIRDEAIESATDVRGQLSQQFGERGRVLAGRQAFRRRFEEHGTHMEQTGNALLETYRAANRRARSAPAPAHFGQRWTLGRLPLPDAPVTSANEAELRAAESALDEAVTEISGKFDAAVQSFEPLDVLKLRLADGKA